MTTQTPTQTTRTVIAQAPECQKLTKMPDRTHCAPYYDPADMPGDLLELDPTSRRILEIEMANPGISAQDIKRVGKFAIKTRQINVKRSDPIYQRLLYESSKSAIQLISDFKVDAVRFLKGVMDDKSARIQDRVMAAKFLAASAQEAEIKRAELELRLHEQQEALERGDKKMIVEIEYPDGMIFVTDPPAAAAKALGAPPAEPAPSEVDVELEGGI